MLLQLSRAISTSQTFDLFQIQDQTGSIWLAAHRSWAHALVPGGQEMLYPSSSVSAPTVSCRFWDFGISLHLERAFTCWIAHRTTCMGRPGFPVRFSVTSGAVAKVELILPSSLSFGGSPPTERKWGQHAEMRWKMDYRKWREEEKDVGEERCSGRGNWEKWWEEIAEARALNFFLSHDRSISIFLVTQTIKSLL